MNILSEYKGPPEAAAIAVAFLTILGIATVVFIIFLIKWFIEDKEQRKPIIFLLMLTFILLGVCIGGNIAILSKQEHVLKVTLNETYSATQLLEHYNIRDIEGQIYTIVEK